MMSAPTAFEVLGLTLLALAFPFHNWLVMLRATKARDAGKSRSRYAGAPERDVSGW